MSFNNSISLSSFFFKFLQFSHFQMYLFKHIIMLLLILKNFFIAAIAIFLAIKIPAECFFTKLSKPDASNSIKKNSKNFRNFSGIKQYKTTKNRKY
jgi:hypothetical protein